jgi:hypothetical protein
MNRPLNTKVMTEDLKLKGGDSQWLLGTSILSTLNKEL